jgi:hypothetical protein
MVHIVKASKSRGSGADSAVQLHVQLLLGICLGHAVDPVAVINSLQQFVNAKSIQIGGQLYLWWTVSRGLIGCCKSVSISIGGAVQAARLLETVMTAGTGVKQTGLVA